MLTKFGLTLMVAVGMLLMVGNVAEAAGGVTIQGMSLGKRQDGSETTQPYGRFDTPVFPNGGGGLWRVRVTYGLYVGGEFSPYTTGDGAGQMFSTPPEDAGRGLSNKPWYLGGPKVWGNGIGAATVARAQLQNSTDGGVTWSVAEAVATIYVK